MSITVRIAHFFPIDRLATVFGNIKTIIEIQRPRHLEHLITIGIHCCLFHFLLGNAALIGTCLRIFPFLGRIFLIFLLIGILSAAQLLFPLFPRFVIKRIAKGRTVSLENTETSVGPFRTVILYHISILIELITVCLE